MNAVDTDAVIVGAGPVGLFQAFQLGLLDVRTHIVDALPEPGGQCLALYPDKPIYDIPAVPVCTGRELVERLLRQLAPFPLGWHLGQVVSSVQTLADGRLAITARAAHAAHGPGAAGGEPCAAAGGSACVRFVARALVVAAGVGAFLPRRLNVAGLDAFVGTQVHHHPEPAALDAWPAGGDCLVVGGDAAAIGCALHLAGGGRQRSVTLLHRRSVLEAPAGMLDALQVQRDAGRLRFVVGQVVACGAADGRLRTVTVAPPEGEPVPLPVDALAVCLGLVPQLGPLAGWGLALDRKQVTVDTAGHGSSVPGVHAVGDVASYPGKKKLIVCGFHEATLAAHAIAARLHPERPATLQYTTTSPQLHRLLGVGGPGDAAGR